MKEVIRNLIRDALVRMAKNNGPGVSNQNTVNIEVSRTKDERFGDYSTNAALILAGPLGMKPRDLALSIAQNFTEDPTLLSGWEIAGPGFINFFLAPAVWHEALHSIHEQKEEYGRSSGKPRARVLLEFVSANPTGPLHVGHGRGAAVGDSLARLLRTCGYDVETEYYVNDSGNQMKILGLSVMLRYKELLGEHIVFPDDCYQGDYIRDIAQGLMGTDTGRLLESLPDEKAIEMASSVASENLLEGIKHDLENFGVTHDKYYSEKSLHESGAVDDTLDELRRTGKTEDLEGALWFKMAGQEDEEDRVLVRATGEPTYFAADAAYHMHKLRRGFGMLIDIWGSDHHGYVPRVRAAVEALGYPSDALRVLLVQFVNLIRDGRKISMSTRSGEFITLREVLEEVGPDAARFFFLSKRCDSHLEFDLDLAKRQSKDNPVYYVQYAHARVSAIFRIAAERGIDSDMTDPDLTALSLPEEKRIMKYLADFPDMLAEAAEILEPHRITFYLMGLAELFHAYYHDNRVLIEDARVKKARLYLVEAVRQVVANGLKILGVSAPNRM
jgi:arginyl-tRNA synthetase